MARKADPYSNIEFSPHVDWQHVQPILLQKINQIARAKGQLVDVFSGYRTNAYSAAHGGFEGDPHTQGAAVDAYVNGKPIGEVWSAADFKNASLRTGNQPGFYHGKTDPEHVDLFVDGYTPPADQGGTTAPTDQQTGALTAGALIQQDLASAPPTPGSPTVGPNVVGLPGTAFVQPVQKPRYQTWDMLSSLPGASPDTMQMAQLAGLQNPTG